MASSPRQVARPFGGTVQRIEELRCALDEAERRFQTALRRCQLLSAEAVRARLLYERAAQSQSPPVPAALFRREGEFWTIAYAGGTCRLRDVKGLRYLAFLLGATGREVHALELAAAVDGLDPRRAERPAEASLPAVGADALLDAHAKEAYRRRLQELEDDLRQARDWQDPERIARIEDEIEALTGELARAAGLGGRDRQLPSPAERARVSVTKAIRTAIRAIEKHHPALGAHLTASVRTGRHCCYAPPGETPPRWSL
jgi:hypothetical protein